MRIKRLDIAGFKSFKEPSVFTFDDGVTAIVGPNGCGKSNVVDAIRWVMGEQSAKNLRGRAMEDVIFSGSEAQAALSMAEVTLTLKDTANDNLALQYAAFPEITVTRRLFRNGDSEYLINKTPCRLLDITELFLGTGVGTRAYSIIEQGRVGLIVSSKPEDRRALIEEAAGVTKYKARRKAAERKLEYTQQNLLRVTDIVNELESRLESLGRQARKAEKYKKLKQQVREIELHVAAHRFLEYHAEQKVLTARLESLSNEEKKALEEVRRLDGVLGEERTELDQSALDLQGLQEKVHSIQSQVRLDEQNLQYWGKDLDTTRQRMDEIRAEEQELQKRGGELADQCTAREEELSRLAAQWKQDEVALAVAQEESRRVSELHQNLSRKFEQERGQLVEVASALANQESNLTNLGRQRADLELRHGRCEGEIQAYRKEEQGLEKAKSHVLRRVGETRELALQLSSQREVEETALSQARQEFAENEVQLICAREELADRRSRLQSLREIQRNYEGFDRGVRAVMQRAGDAPREMGIFGLVADLISTAPQLEKAIEAALGERLQHVVVESVDKGVELVEYLKSTADGRSSFIPKSRPPVAGDSPPTHEQIIALAAAEAHCEEGLRPLIESLLRDVAIVRDLAAAQIVSRAHPRGLTCVTLDGEVFYSDGTVTGGAMEGPAVGSLQKKREIAELADEVGRLEQSYNGVVTRHYELQKRMGNSESLLKSLAKNAHAEEVNLASQEKDLHKATEDLSRIREHLRGLDEQLAELDSKLHALRLEEEACRGQIAHGQTDREAREERLRQMAAELKVLLEHLEAMGAEVTSLRIKVAENAQRADAYRREIEDNSRQRAELAERATRLKDSLGEASAKLIGLEQSLAATAEVYAGRQEELKVQSEALERSRQDHSQKQGQIREKEIQLRDFRARMDELTQGVSQISLREREIEIELSHLMSQVQDRHSADLTLELHRFHLEPRISAEEETRLREVRAQIERMGEINLTAIEEHAEVLQRCEFLRKEKKDLDESIHHLKEAIAKINRTSRERFVQTFETINEKFQQVFPRLFGGGRAGLVLTDEGPGLEQGVEIVAQPPGKKLQSVSLLSGGEKALTAVSLVFSIFLIKPTPFCLLDEVDAPLDDANVGRYNDIVREMSKQSQFILITHSKCTMEIADNLYGVTMEEPGVSKLVSVRLREAISANDPQAAQSVSA